MAVICENSGRRLTLAAHSLVGRSRDCFVQIDSPRVSAEHAVVEWEHDQWTVRDLSSRNGTLVDGKRLPAGVRAVLTAGAHVAFSDSEWTLETADAPLARATSIDTGTVLEEDDEGVLLLSPPPSTVAVVALDDCWMLEASSKPRRQVCDQEVITVGADRWLLGLPRPSDSAAGRTESVRELLLSTVLMRFTVSRDEEHVSIQLSAPEIGVVQLPSRAHQHILLSLARARATDQRAGLPESEAGWVYSDDLQRALGMDRTRVNIELLRARRLFEKYGVTQPEALVERRSDTLQLRLGVARLEFGN